MNITLGEVLSVRLAGDPAENIDKSIATFELALSTITPESEPALWIRAARALATNFLHRLRGNIATDLEKAIALFETIQSSTRAADSVEASCITDLNLALAYLRRSGGSNAVDEAKAKVCLDRALGVPMQEWCNPSAWATAVFVRGNIHAQQGGLDSAIADFAALLATPEVPEQQKLTAQIHQAMAYQQQGKSDLAIAAYTAALATTDAPAEETARAFLNRGIVHGAQGKSELEIADYAAVLAMPCAPAEQKARALLNRGIAQAEHGKLDSAIDDYSAVITMHEAGDEIKAGALLNRGIIYTWQGKPDLAIADYTSVITVEGVSPNHKTKALLNRADEHRRQGQVEKAIVDYVEVGAIPEAPADLKSHAAVMRVATVVAGEQATQGEKASAEFSSTGAVSNDSLGVPREISSAPLLVESFDSNGAQRSVIDRADRYARKKRHPCLFPGCAATAIGSHAIQRASILEALALNGVVYTRRQSLNPAMKLTEAIDPVDVVSMGVNNASVFNGFCPHHDSRLFAAAEATDRATKRHIFAALHLRAIALEYDRKRWVGDFFRKASELTGNPDDRSRYLARADTYMTICEFQREVYLAPLLSRDGHTYTHGIAYFCLPFSCNLRVSSCGCFQVTKEPGSLLGFNLISYSDLSLLVLTTFKVWESHLDSFLAEYNLPAGAERLVNDIAFSEGEEPLIAPQLWQTLTPDEQCEVALSLRQPAFREPGARIPQVIKIRPHDLVVSGATEAVARVVERLGDGLRP